MPGVEHIVEHSVGCVQHCVVEHIVGRSVGYFQKCVVGHIVGHVAQHLRKKEIAKSHFGCTHAESGSMQLDLSWWVHLATLAAVGVGIVLIAAPIVENIFDCVGVVSDVLVVMFAERVVLEAVDEQQRVGVVIEAVEVVVVVEAVGVSEAVGVVVEAAEVAFEVVGVVVEAVEVVVEAVGVVAEAVDEQ